MEWAKREDGWRVPVKSWCANLEQSALEQAANLAKHPAIFHHVALMPDAHAGYGMPIGGVAAFETAVVPYAVGNDAGCGMHSVQTNLPAELMSEMSVRRDFQNRLKKRVPVGEAVHSQEQSWDGFDEYLDNGGNALLASPRIRKALGTVGGGNHFVELQKSDKVYEQYAYAEEGMVWFMVHTGSRSLGGALANLYHTAAVGLCHRWHSAIPCDELAFLPVSSEEGQAYLRDMTFALKYALENRRRIAAVMKETLFDMFGGSFDGLSFLAENDVHHNYASLEHHFGKDVWVHRKGATLARAGGTGIIPGSMGTASYIVEGCGNEESFCSSSHGAGRRMSRTAANSTFTVEECDKAMEGIVCERWQKVRGWKKGESVETSQFDLSESPMAYKDIENVMNSQKDLVGKCVRLVPLACLKG